MPRGACPACRNHPMRVSNCRGAAILSPGNEGFREMATDWSGRRAHRRALSSRDRRTNPDGWPLAPLLIPILHGGVPFHAPWERGARAKFCAFGPRTRKSVELWRSGGNSGEAQPPNAIPTV